MKKKKAFLIILLVLGTLLLAFGIVLKFTSSNNKNNSNNEYKKSGLIERWYYVDFEFYDENDNMIEKPFNMENFYLDFYTKTVDVCYDKCYTTTYTKDNNILTIDDFDYFSGKFEVSYKDNMMLLKTVSEGAYIIYYFGEPIETE